MVVAGHGSEPEGMDGGRGDCLYLSRGHTDIFGSYGIWPSQLSHELLCIKPHFNDIVEEGEHRCQRKGGHKEGDKAKLDD